MSLRYKPEQSRLSRDLDAAIRSDSDAFEKELERRLEHGLNGFTGKLKYKPRRTDTAGTQAGMRPYIVSLSYNNKPFAKIEFEAAPDHSGFSDNAVQHINSQTYDLLHDLGIPIKPPAMISPVDQLADKLHAVTRPGGRRGRDLADIMTLTTETDLSDLDSLRSTVRRVEENDTVVPHKVQMLDLSDEEKADMRDAFEQSKTRYDFDECLSNTQLILQQVDERYKDKWVDSWQEAIKQKNRSNYRSTAEAYNNVRAGEQPRLPNGQYTFSRLKNRPTPLPPPED